MPIIGQHFAAALNWLAFQNLSWLPNVALVIFPNKEEGNTLESIDKREEEILNKELMMNSLEVVE